MKRMVRPRIRQWTTDRLIRVVLKRGSAGRGWEAVAELHDRGSPALLERVEALVRSPRPRRRVLGLDIAAQLRTPGAVRKYEAEPYALEATRSLLIAALGDPHPDVLQAAVMGLGHRPAQQALPALLAHEQHPSAEIRFALAHALGSHADPEATAALLRLASDPDEDVRNWATFGIGTLRDADDAGIRALLWKNAHDPNRDVRGEAVVGLARRSDPRVVELLNDRLLDGDCRVYELEAAEEMPRAELLAPLQRLRAEAEKSRDIDSYWYRCLLDAIDACELVADATP